MQQIPSEADWRSVPWCLDIPYAYDHFFGKTLAQAVSLFQENAMYYQEDLMFMPKACLAYYIDAYNDYLLSNRSEGDSDGASCFFGLVEIRHGEIKEFSLSTIDSTKAVLHKLAEHQKWYDAEPDIYGNFRDKAEQLLLLLN